MTARITSPQKKQIGQFVEDAAESLGLSKDAAQRIIAQGGTLVERLKPILLDLAAEKSPSEIHAAKHILDGWEIVKGEDVAPTLASIDNLELVEFLVEADNGYVDGKTMRQRAIEKQAKLGLSDAAWLYERQAQIPPEFRSYYLIFAGTVLRSPDGRLFVPYLCWDGGRWCLHFHWLGRDWRGDDRLVRCK